MGIPTIEGEDGMDRQTRVLSRASNVCQFMNKYLKKVEKSQTQSKHIT